MYRFDTNGQMTMLDLDTAERGGAPPKRRPGKPDSELVSIPYFHLDLLSSPVDLFAPFSSSPLTMVDRVLKCGRGSS